MQARQDVLDRLDGNGRGIPIDVVSRAGHQADLAVRGQPGVGNCATLWSSLPGGPDEITGAKFAAVAPRPGNGPGDLDIPEHHGVATVGVQEPSEGA